MPALAEVLINERDEYISQTVVEIASQVSRRGIGNGGSIVAVVGAGECLYSFPLYLSPTSIINIQPVAYTSIFFLC